MAVLFAAEGAKFAANAHVGVCVVLLFLDGAWTGSEGQIVVAAGVGAGSAGVVSAGVVVNMDEDEVLVVHAVYVLVVVVGKVVGEAAGKAVGEAVVESSTMVIKMAVFQVRTVRHVRRVHL